MVSKDDLVNCITETLFREELLNVVDAYSVESLENDVRKIIMDHLKEYVIIAGQILE